MHVYSLIDSDAIIVKACLQLGWMASLCACVCVCKCHKEIIFAMTSPLLSVLLLFIGLHRPCHSI